MFGFMGFITVPVLIIIAALIFVANQYKRCPSNKVIVVYGKTGGTSTAKCVHGGGTFIIPLIQDYGVLSLEPMTTDIDLKGALSKGNIRVAVPSTFTFGISTKDAIMINAAERLLGLTKSDIIVQASDIILGQLRLAIATLTIEEINQDREKFLEQINANVNTELNKIGLEIINVNIKDITDESGYIDAIGKKAAAEAINKAKVEVAQQEKLGEVAKANAERDVLIAQKEREEARLKKEELARQEVEKLKIQVEADAEAERLRRIANGEADAIKAKYFAEAQGVQAVLEAKAKGYDQLVKISNNKPEIATSFLMIEKIEDIVARQVEAIKNIKFDKITVWDGGAGSKEGSTTANFMRDLIKALPAMHDLAGQAGVELPSILGKVASQEDMETASVVAAPKKFEKEEK